MKGSTHSSRLLNKLVLKLVEFEPEDPDLSFLGRDVGHDMGFRSQLVLDSIRDQRATLGL